MMESIRVGDITIYTEAFTGGIVLAVMLLAWFRPVISAWLGWAVMALWLVTAGYLAHRCYGYDGPMWEWQILGVDYWRGLSAIESCMTGTADGWGGVLALRLLWGAPMLGIGLVMIRYLVVNARAQVHDANSSRQ